MRPVQPRQVVELDHLPPRVTTRDIEPARETIALADDPDAPTVALPHTKPWSLNAQIARVPAREGGRR
jgi:hypothetical protein